MIVLIACLGQAYAQYDPLNAQWGKLDPHHIRVMTWNIEDGISSGNTKTDIVNDWNALVRVVAALQPDILVMQEVGDNSGNGQAGGLDSIGTLQNVINLFLHGGTDPYQGGGVTSYVQKYAGDPSYDLPYVYVSEESDGYNRNVILSRWPFADLNGDGRSLYNDIYFVSGSYAAGDGGIRGFQFAEIDLPDDQYAGDLVIGNGHLKSGGGTSNEAQRVYAAKNVGYYIEHFYNGAGTGMVDPDNSVSDGPRATRVLDDDTPVIVCGDWNSDPDAPLLNSTHLKQPPRWIIEGQVADDEAGAPDGTDRDGTDMSLDGAKRVIISWNNQVFEGSSLTNSAGKIDHVVYQDSIITAANKFVYDPFEHNGVFPPSVASYPGQPYNIVKDAADHWPVTVDFVFAPAAQEPLCADLNCDGLVDAFDIDPFVIALLSASDYAAQFPDCNRLAGDINRSGELDAFDIDPFVNAVLNAGCE